MNDETPSVGVEAWLRAIKASNPFVSNTVTEADDRSADVRSIHQKEFRRLTKRIHEVRQSGSTAGILLTGAAGLGKSHLLARTFRWAEAEGESTLVYLHNVLASPERLPRYLLRATVSTLAGHAPQDYAECDLYALINRAIQPELLAKGIPSVERRLKALKKIGKDIDPERMVMPVFSAFLQHAMAAGHDETAERLSQAAVRWLAGETIESDVAEEIGLKANGEWGAHIPDDEGVQRTLDVIARLCGKAQRPFVLCVDQVDNLDDEKVTALTAFLQALLDNGKNLVVITSGVKQSMLSFRKRQIIPDAAWDRLAKHTIELDKIGPNEAREMVKARVHAFTAPFKDVPAIAQLLEKDPLLPLESRWLEERFAKVIEVRPRDVIDWSRSRWDQEQDALEDQGDVSWLTAKRTGNGPGYIPSEKPVSLTDAIDRIVSKKLLQARTSRTLKPESLPPDADNLATLTHQLLSRCVGRAEYSLRELRRISSKKGPVIYDITAREETAHGEAATNGLKFITEENGRSTVWSLKRLSGDKAPPTHRIVVTDDERRPLKLGKAGKDVYDKLTAKKALEHIKLSFEDYARLDAMSVVLGSARVGDLEVGLGGGTFRTVSEEECLESMHRQGVLLAHPLLRELLTEQPKEENGKPHHGGPVDRQKLRQRLVFELQWRLGMTGREMALIVLEREKLPKSDEQAVFEVVFDEATKMHKEGHLYATAQDDDLFLQLRKGKK